MDAVVSDPRIATLLLCSRPPRPILVPNPLPREMIYRLIYWFKLLIADPNRDTWKLDKDLDNGLIRKDPTKEDDTKDPKWLFHYKPMTFWKLANEQGLDTSPYRKFINTCDAAVRVAKTSVEPIIHTLDEQLPGYAFWRNFEASECVLRLIKDDPPAISHRLEVATKHTDFGFLTQHLFESRPHLVWFCEKTGEWIPIDFNNVDNQPAVLFFGRKASLMTGGKRCVENDGTQTKEVLPRSGLLEPLLHKVVEIGDMNELTTARFAVVAFFHIPLVL